MTTLLINDELRERGAKTARWRVVDPVVRDGFVKLFDREKHIEEHALFERLNAQIGEEELVLLRDAAPRLSPAVQADPKLDARLQAASECLLKVLDIQRKRNCSFAAAYQAATGADGDPRLVDSALPSRPTLYRYLQATRKGIPVLRGDKNKGNRTARYAEEVTSLIETAAETHFLVPGSSWDWGDLTDYVNNEVHSLKLLDTKKRISQEFVRRVVFENLSVDTDIDRMDPKLRAAAKSIGAERIVVALPFDRVEQDALHIPNVIDVNGQPARNVYLVHSIDCSTGMPAGWHLTVGNPSESHGLKCVESTLYSKAAAFKRLGLDREIDIDICGTPRKLVLDNGPETRGQRMLRLVRLGITLQYCKSRHAHHKPFIERLNRSLKRALQRLPGSTRFNGKDGARDPVSLGERLMTLEELERWIVKWYYQKWAKTELVRHMWSDFHDCEKLGRTPQQRWMNFPRRGFPRRLSPPLSAWQMTLYEHDERTLSRKTGISFDGFHFRGPNLKYLVQKYGESMVKFMYDPDDYRQIWVFDGESMPLVPLVERYATPESLAHSFAYMQAERAKMAAEGYQDPAVAKFDQEMHHKAVDTSIMRNTKKKTKTEQNRLAAATVKFTEAVQRTASRPLVVQTQSAPLKQDGCAAYTFDDVPELPALSRSTGEAQQ